MVWKPRRNRKTISTMRVAALRKAMSILLTEVPTIRAALSAILQMMFLGRPFVNRLTPVCIFPVILSEPELGSRQTVTVVSGRFPSPEAIPQEESFNLTWVILPKWSTPLFLLAWRTTPLNLLGAAKWFPIASAHRNGPLVPVTGRLMQLVEIRAPRAETVRKTTLGARPWTCTVPGLSYTCTSQSLVFTISMELIFGRCASLLATPRSVQPSRHSLSQAELWESSASTTMTPDDRPPAATFRMTMVLGRSSRVTSIWPRITMAVTLTLALIVNATASEQVLESDEPESTQSTLLILPIRRLTGNFMARVIALVLVFGQKVDIRMAGGATLGHRVTGSTRSAINLVIIRTRVRMAVNTGSPTKNPITVPHPTGPTSTLLSIPSRVAAIHCLLGWTLSTIRWSALLINRLGLTRWQCMTPELPITQRNPFNRLALTEVLCMRIVLPRLSQGKATAIHSLSPNLLLPPLRPVWMPSALADRLMPGERQLSALAQSRCLLRLRCTEIRAGTPMPGLPRLVTTPTCTNRPLLTPKPVHTTLLPHNAVNAMGRIVLPTQPFILQSVWAICLLQGVWTQ